MKQDVVFLDLGSGRSFDEWRYIFRNLDVKFYRDPNWPDGDADGNTHVILSNSKKLSKTLIELSNKYWEIGEDD